MVQGGKNIAESGRWRRMADGDDVSRTFGNAEAFLSIVGQGLAPAATLKR